MKPCVDETSEDELSIEFNDLKKSIKNHSYYARKKCIENKHNIKDMEKYLNLVKCLYG